MQLMITFAYNLQIVSNVYFLVEMSQNYVFWCVIDSFFFNNKKINMP